MNVDKLGEVERRCNAIMIGALASFEDIFGYLWGHGKPLKEKTEQEIVFLDLWEEARVDLLDKCNEQINYLLRDLIKKDDTRKKKW